MSTKRANVTAGQTLSDDTRHVRKRSAIGVYGERYALLGAWGVVIVIFAILSPTGFLSVGNFATMFGSQAVLVILTLGLLLPLTAGDFDLSVGSVMALSSMMLGVMNVNHNVPIMLAILAAIGMGAAVGFINGMLTTVFEIDSFIVTLGMGTIGAGIVLWISGSMTISGISPTLVRLVVTDRFLGIPLEFYYGLVLCVGIWYFFEFTPLGRRVLFVGRGRNVARLSGVNVGRVRWGCFVACGIISALAGVAYAGTTGAADPTSALAYLLPAMAAAFLGATAVKPGRFNAWGSLIAVYFLITGITGLSILGLQSYVQNLFYGGALIVAVVFSQLVRKRQEARE